MTARVLAGVAALVVAVAGVGLAVDRLGGSEQDGQDNAQGADAGVTDGGDVAGGTDGAGGTDDAGGTDGGGSGDEPDSAGSGTTGESPGKGGSATTTSLDRCLVGSWRTLEHQEQAPPFGAISGLQRRSEVTRDGRLTVTYDEARVQAGASRLVFDGTIVYRLASDGSRLSFDLERNDATLTVDGTTVPFQPGTSGVDYTCSGDRWTESAPGFEAVYGRLR